MKGNIIDFVVEITNFRSIIRRFDQCLQEGETRFVEEAAHIQALINNYFNVESIVERIRTSQGAEKKGLWQDMKLIGNIRSISDSHLHSLFSHGSFDGNHLCQVCGIYCVSSANDFDWKKVW